MPNVGSLNSSSKALDASARSGGGPVIEMGFVNPNQFLDRTGRNFWGADFHNFVEGLGDGLEKATRGFRGVVSRNTPKDTGALRSAAFSYIARGNDVETSAGTTINLTAFRSRNRYRGRQDPDPRAKLPASMRDPIHREGIFIEAGYQAYKTNQPLFPQMLAVEYGTGATPANRALGVVRQRMLSRVRGQVRANVNKYLGQIRRSPGRGGADVRTPTTEAGRRRIRKEAETIKSNIERYAATKAQYSGSSRTISTRFPSAIKTFRAPARRRSRRRT